MYAVAEFMRERHYVARLALIIEQHIGMRRRRGGMGESARRLARPHRRVDPAIGEETLGDIGHLRREAAIRRQHHFCASGQAMVPFAAKGSGALRSQWASFFFLNQPAFSP